MCGVKMSAGDFGNYIAGFQGGVWDSNYPWYRRLAGLDANQAVEAAGIYYHLTKQSDVPNDPWDHTGMPWIHLGENAGPKFNGRDCGCQ